MESIFPEQQIFHSSWCGPRPIAILPASTHPQTLPCRHRPEQQLTPSLPQLSPTPGHVSQMLARQLPEQHSLDRSQIAKSAKHMPPSLPAPDVPPVPGLPAAPPPSLVCVVVVPPQLAAQTASATTKASPAPATCKNPVSKAEPICVHLHRAADLPLFPLGSLSNRRKSRRRAYALVAGAASTGAATYSLAPAALANRRTRCTNPSLAVTGAAFARSVAYGKVWQARTAVIARSRCAARSGVSRGSAPVARVRSRRSAATCGTHRKYAPQNCRPPRHCATNSPKICAFGVAAPGSVCTHGAK